MSGPQRAPDQTGISVSMAKSLLEDIDKRATKLGLTRSQYFAQLARNDIAAGGAFVVRETSPSSSDTANSSKVDAAVEAAIKYTLSKRRKKK